jgi:hypothetical protein
MGGSSAISSCGVITTAEAYGELGSGSETAL